MKPMLEWPMELVGLGGVVAVLAYVVWTKVTLGCAITAIGALFRRTSADRAQGTGELKMNNGAKAVMKGSLRIGMILAGLILVLNGSIGTKGRYETARISEALELREKDRLIEGLLETPLWENNVHSAAWWRRWALAPEHLRKLPTAQLRKIVEQVKLDDAALSSAWLSARYEARYRDPARRTNSLAYRFHIHDARLARPFEADGPDSR